MTLTQIKPAGLSKPVDLADNEKIRLGTGNDLQIYHDGTFNYIAAPNNHEVHINANSGGSTENIAKFKPNGAVELYHNGNKKLETLSNGAKITGTFVPDGDGNRDLGSTSLQWQNIYIDNDLFIGDNGKAIFGDGSDLQIYHDTENYIKSATASVNLILESAHDVYIKHGGENMLKCAGDGAVELYYDNSKKLETTSAGATVTGDLIITDDLFLQDNLYMGDTDAILLGNSEDLQIYHDGSHSYIYESGTGHLRLKSNNAILFETDSFTVNNEANSENLLSAVSNGAVKLYYDNSKKFETTSAGVSVSGASDGVLNLDTSDSRGAFVRFGQGGSFHNMVGCADGITSGDKEDLGVRAADNIIFASGGSSERMRIDSSGNVGIGTNSPGELLSLKNTSAQVNMSLQAATNGSCAIFFGDTDTVVRSVIKHHNNDDSLAFFSGGNNERMRIDASGNVGIGTTSPVRNLHITDTSPRIMLSNDTTGHASGDGTELMLDNSGNFELLQRENLNLEFFTNNTQRMTILGNGRVGIGQANPQANLHIKVTGTDSPYQQFESANYNTFIGTAQADNNLGTGSKAGNLVLRGQTGVAIMGNNGTTTQVKVDADGLKFNADTAAANALDDYEEGTWTPSAVVTHNGSGNGSVSSANATGLYTKIGRQVTCHMAIDINASNISGCNVGINGLPFTISSSSINFNVGVARRGMIGGEMFVFEGARHNTTQIEVLRMYNNNGLSSANQSIKGTFTYTAAT